MADASAEWRSEPPPGGWDQVVAERAEIEEDQHRMLVVSGCLSLLAGVGAILVPALASVGTAVFIGIVLIAASVAIGIGAFAMAGAGRKLLTGLLAVFTLAMGIYLAASPLEGTFTLTVMLVIWFAGVGLVRIGIGIAHLGQRDAGYTILAGAVSLALGVLIAVELPSSADWAIGLLVGIDFLIYGVLALGRAWVPAANE
jgi:uncharacterized membrane protein HdeD (DUF308 family)